jgi:V/A-type H+/Na+-transporting ATPase subunit A
VTATAVPLVRRVAGALVEAQPMTAGLFELARVGHAELLGEVVRQVGDVATLQVYEDTTGLAVGEPVAPLGATLQAELGPGLLGAVLDGIGRPLARLADATGDWIGPGAQAPTLDPARRWPFVPSVPVGTAVTEGDEIGSVAEGAFTHRILVPPGVAGTVVRIEAASLAAGDTACELDNGTLLPLAQRWPVRVPRPVRRRLAADRPFVTGQRVFDLFFPVAEGGAVAVPGGFGTGKTMLEQSLARHAEADVVVYVGCGERGNEMTDVLTEFPELTDPHTGRPLMERSVLVVNTSNMPVAAREASIYLGVTIAEYFRDQGLRVALMVDSASRWAEALRELAARLQEMPGEEGYPTSLASRFGTFLERAGRVETLGRVPRQGAVTTIAAISPPGGDFSEPVTQAALRVVSALWALDPALASQRHYPAVDWDTSFSLDAARVAPWFAAQAGDGWHVARAKLLELLERERALRDIASLVGPEALEEGDRLVLAVAALVRELVLRQSALDPVDASCPPSKALVLAEGALAIAAAGAAALAAGRPFAELDLAGVTRALAAVRDAAPPSLGAASETLRAATARLARGA